MYFNEMKEPAALRRGRLQYLWITVTANSDAVFGTKIVAYIMAIVVDTKGHVSGSLV